MRLRLLVVALFVAVLAWAALWWRSRRAPVPAAAPAAATDSSVAGGVTSVRLYFATSDAERLVSESREMMAAQDLHQRVAMLVGELDRGPRGGAVSVLPPGTSLRHAFLDADGLLTVDLSSAFRDGFRGGSAAEYLAVASLVRTLGANLPEVKRVLIVCGGSPLESLGGHIPLNQPLDVSDW
jgi:spore germination protein GerM